MYGPCRLLKAYLKIKCVECKLVPNDVTTDFHVLDRVLTSGTSYLMWVSPSDQYPAVVTII